MAVRKTIEKFIADARKVHGDKYDYTETVYGTSNKIKVTVNCPEHGSFKVSPDNHLRGRGCPHCKFAKLSKLYLKPSGQFIEQAKVIHGTTYNYDLVQYAGAKNKVKIVCPSHGEFEQTPDMHLQGQGCYDCGIEKSAATCRYSKEDFIRKARSIHGDTYDYSKVTYRNFMENVTIGCKVHGWFEQTPQNHLIQKSGCKECAKIRISNLQRKGTPKFIAEARSIHGNRYDYSLVKYKSYHENIEIICHKHGVFRQTPATHLKGAGCNECGNENIGSKLRRSLEEFLFRAREVHGDFYDYSLVEYKTAKVNVKIVCPIHGIFEQLPDTHVNRKSGCNECANESLPGAYSSKRLIRDEVLANKPALLYYLRFSDSDESFYKVGITQTSLKQRYAGIEKRTGYNYQVLAIKKMSLIEAFNAEQALIENHVKLLPYNPMKRLRKDRSKLSGHTECFNQPLPEKHVTKFFSK